MKKSIILFLLTCLPLSAFAITTLTCPSIDDLNKAIADLPEKVVTPDNILPFAGFNKPFTYIGQSPLKKVTTFEGVFIPVSKNTQNQLHCVYRGIDKHNTNDVSAYFLNADMGPYQGVVGKWIAGEGRVEQSNCYSYSSDVKECQFIRNNL